MLPEEKRIRSREELQEWLELELRPYRLGGMQKLLNLIDGNEAAILRRHMVLLRTTEYHINTGHTLRAAWYHMRLMRLQNRYGLHVPVNCFGKGLTILHLYPILMNGNVTVGEYCRIMPGVKIVGDDTPEDHAPVLGDHVTLGAGCTVLGGIELADGITVGAGAVVTKSFPEPGISIAGVPAKKLG